MSTTANSQEYTVSRLQQAKTASYKMACLPAKTKNDILKAFAQLLTNEADFLLAENKKDLDAAQKDTDLSDVLKQRLKLDTAKIEQLAQGLLDVAQFDDPVGKVLAKTQLDDGLILEKRTVPLGCVGIIFESRPDVLPQILSLVLKTGNSVVFKGGREAAHSNAAMMKLVEKLQQQFNDLPKGWAQLLETREAAQEMLNYPQYLDLMIPRGSNELVQSILAKSKVPVLGHADGICHLYVDETADLEKSIAVCVDAKIQYPAACNALETLLVDVKVAPQFLPLFKQAAQQNGITLIGCEKTQAIITVEPATVADWKTEYGDLRLSIKVVENLEAAIEHINTYGSHHTDGILSSNPEAIDRFMLGVDSANVYANCSTRFADGFRYGFGAEVGISTSKTHARGPVGIDGLLSYQYRLTGEYQVVKTYTGQNPKAFQHQSLDS